MVAIITLATTGPSSFLSDVCLLISTLILFLAPLTSLRMVGAMFPAISKVPAAMITKTGSGFLFAFSASRQYICS